MKDICKKKKYMSIYYERCYKIDYMLVIIKIITGEYKKAEFL